MEILFVMPLSSTLTARIYGHSCRSGSCIWWVSSATLCIYVCIFGFWLFRLLRLQKYIYKPNNKNKYRKKRFFSSLGPFFRVRRSYSACVAASAACLAAHVRAALFCRTGRTISANHRPMSINYSIFATVSVPRVPHPTRRTTAARHKLKALQ